MNYTRITSPINGIVGLRQVDVGNIVTASGSTGLVVITQVQPIAVIFTLPEDQLPAVFEHMRGGRKLVAEAWDRANTTKIAEGSLLTVDNQIDTTTGTAKLKAVFNNEDNALYPNQFVNIHLVLENRANSLVIPAAAIQTGNNGSFVYVIDRTKPQAPPAAPGGAAAGGSAQGGGANTAGTAIPQSGSGNTDPASSLGGGPVGSAPGGGTAGAGAANGAGAGRHAGGGGGQTTYPVAVVPVVIDSTQGTEVIIKSGLQAGQQVVTDGQEKLQNGSRVIPRPSNDMVAARQARANGGSKPAANPDPDAGAFSNGHGSDQDAGSGTAVPRHGNHAPGGSGSTNAGQTAPANGQHRRRQGGAAQ